MAGGGLRVGEAVRIKVTDIEASALRLRIREGKGGSKAEP